MSLPWSSSTWMNTLVLCILLTLPWSIASYVIAFAKQSMVSEGFWSPREAEGNQKNHRRSSSVMSGHAGFDASTACFTCTMPNPVRFSAGESSKSPPEEISRSLPTSPSALSAGSEVEPARRGAPLRSILKHAHKLRKPATRPFVQVAGPESTFVHKTPVLSPSTAFATHPGLSSSKFHQPSSSSRKLFKSFPKVKKSLSSPSKGGRVTQLQPSVTFQPTTKPAVAPQEPQGFQSYSNTESLEIDPTLLVPHDSISYTSDIEFVETPIHSADDPTPNSLEEWLVSKQIQYDRQLAERLQAMDDGKWDLEYEEASPGIPSHEEMRKRRFKDQDGHNGDASQFRKADAVLPHPSKDYRATSNDLERLFSKPDRSKGVTMPSPSKDYRATPEDLERLFESESFTRGTMSSKRHDSFLRSPQQSQDKEGIIKNRERHKRLAIHGVDHLLPRTSPNAGEPMNNIPREPRGPPLPGYANARYGSTKPTGLRFGPSVNLLRSMFVGSGSREDPIDLSTDENEDVEMFYDSINEQGLPIARHDCAVCGESTPMADMPSLINCAHKSQICAACFALWIESELTGKGWKNITCPHANCPVLLLHQEVQLYATPETFARYDSLAVREALDGVPKFRWCLNPACQSGQEHEDGYIFTCTECGHQSCVVHNIAWHEGETCDEYDYRASGAKEREQKAQEEASVATINRLSKKCPGPNCAFNIQKNEGCDHMTCKDHPLCLEEQF